MTAPVSYEFTIGGEKWRFEVTPKSGWRNDCLIATVSGIFMAVTLPFVRSYQGMAGIERKQK